MSHYKSNLRDIEFNLFEVLGTRRGARHRAVRGHRRRDRPRDPRRGRPAGPRGRSPSRSTSPTATPPVFDPETHTAPAARGVQEELPAPGWTPSTGAWAPWPSSAAPRRPPVVQLGPRRDGARRQPRALDVRRRPDVRRRALPQRQRARQADRPAHRRQAAGNTTMVLTEPDAGSDVGAGRTKATPNDDGTWNIEGVKRFITSAESDLSDNIIHMVLARPSASRAPAARAPRACRCSSCRSTTSTSRPASSASATASTSPTSSTRWASRSPTPASSPSATRASAAASPPRAGCSARCTTASRRCSRSSRTPG